MSQKNILDQYSKYDGNNFDLDLILNDNENTSSEKKENLTITNLSTIKQQSLTKLTVEQYLINMKNTIFGIIDDIKLHKFNKKIFAKNDRLFYIGLFLVIIFIVYLFIMNFATCFNKNRID